MLKIALCSLMILTAAHAQNPLSAASQRQPWSYGVTLQGGNGVTDNRDGFHFLMAGLQAGRVLTNNYHRLNFEYRAEILPYWQSFTPKFQRVSITPVPGGIAVSQPYTVGGTYSGASVVPIILRINLAGTGRVTPWVQAAGGVLWTNHKYPAYGDTSSNYNTNGPNGETSVWNFTPQGGIGAHYFTQPRRSIDFGINAQHLSSASLGDRNPGVNVSIQASIGYSWWK